MNARNWEQIGSTRKAKRRWKRTKITHTANKVLYLKSSEVKSSIFAIIVITSPTTWSQTGCRYPCIIISINPRLLRSKAPFGMSLVKDRLPFAGKITDHALPRNYQSLMILTCSSVRNLASADVLRIESVRSGRSILHSAPDSLLG